MSNKKYCVRKKFKLLSNTWIQNVVARLALKIILWKWLWLPKAKSPYYINILRADYRTPTQQRVKEKKKELITSIRGEKLYTNRDLFTENYEYFWPMYTYALQ